MSDQTNLFKQDTQTPATNSDGSSNPSNASPNSSYENLLKNIKNERGEQKYKTVEDAMVGLLNAQQYIPKLKEELETYKSQVSTFQSELEKVKHIEETVNNLLSNQQQQSTQSAPVIDENKIADIVGQTLSRREQEIQQKQNINIVVSEVAKKFGEKSEEAFYGLAKEMGLSNVEMNALAAKSPKAVLTMLGINTSATKPVQPSTASSVNSEAFKPVEQTTIGKNTNGVLFGASTNELINERRNANKMLDELAAKGMSINDLSDPKKYAQFFNN